MKWRLIEEFGPYCYEEQEDGKLLFHGFYSDMDSLTVWLLTFGDRIELLEPEEVKDRLLNVADGIRKIYGGECRT